MKAIKVMGTVNNQGQLFLDNPLGLEQDSRVEVIVLISEENQFDADDEPKQQILNDLRQSLQDAKLGKIRPISELWDGIDVE